MGAFLFQFCAILLDQVSAPFAAQLDITDHDVINAVFDQRTGLEEVNSLVNVLLQAERFGTSVARAMRVHSDLVRKKRMLAAEEKAAAISPKLTVVMILFIFPMLFIVLVGPAVISVIRNLLPTMDGQ